MEQLVHEQKRIFRRLLVPGFIAMACALPVTAVQADFASGARAYEQADFEKARLEWTAAAKSGDVKSQFNLGVLYDEGRGIDIDHAVAVKWWLLAAEGGLAVARHNLASAYIAGDGVKQDYRKAATWLRQSAEQ